MPARAYLPRPEAPAAPVALTDEIQLALAGATPSLEEILSLWPAKQHNRLVLRAKLGPPGDVAISAQLRQDAGERISAPVPPNLFRLRGDVPIVVEHPDGREVVVSLRALRRVL